MNEQVSKFDITQNKKRYMIGISRFIFFTSVAVLIFFIPFKIGGETEILFGYIYNFLIEFFGIVGIWITSLLISINALLSFTGKFISKEGSKLHTYYRKDSKIYVPIYFLGAVYSVLYTLQVSIPQFNGPEAIVGPNTGELMSGIALAVMWVIPLGAIFIPFFVNYGAIDFVGILLQPIMRPLFKVPGKSAVDAITSFLTSSSVAVLFTTKLYNMKFYTKKEAAVITTSFSAVSIGFAAVVIDTAGLMDHFTKVYFSSFLVAFIIAFIMIRIPPLSLKKNVYIDDTDQKPEDRAQEVYRKDTFGVAVSSAINQAASSNPFFKEIKKSLMEGLTVLPKVLSMLFAIGVTFLILAEYTPTFEIIGSAIVPFMQLLNVPDATIIAPSLALGIAEMFLPVLYIADMVGSLDIQARYFVTAVSMVQIIFFAETGAVMLSTGLPLKLWELIVIFTMRTIIAMPLVAIFMHLLF